jgi:hypothetical protein
MTVGKSHRNGVLDPCRQGSRTPHFPPSLVGDRQFDLVGVTAQLRRVHGMRPRRQRMNHDLRRLEWVNNLRVGRQGPDGDDRSGTAPLGNGISPLVGPLRSFHLSRNGKNETPPNRPTKAKLANAFAPVHLVAPLAGAFGSSRSTGARTSTSRSRASRPTGSCLRTVGTISTSARLGLVMAACKGSVRMIPGIRTRSTCRGSGAPPSTWEPRGF